jgi:hypothetical protein
MKTFELGNLGLLELNKDELKKTEGGIIWFIVLAFCMSSCFCSDKLIPRKSPEESC